MNLIRKSLILATSFVGFVHAAYAQEKGTAIIAHRGYWNCEEAGYAQNSVAALKCAQEAGLWGSEFDVYMTADGEIVIFHDGEIDGKQIEKTPYSEFRDFRLENGEPLPTLDMYLKQAKKHPETVLVLEVKWHSSAELERKAVDLCIEKLKARKMFSPDRVVFISFSLNICGAFAEAAPGFTVQYLGNDRRPEEIAGYGINGIDTHYRTLIDDPDWYSAARENGMSVNVWTVDGVEDMKMFFVMGVDQLTTDKPIVAREVLKNMGITETVVGGQ